MKLTEQVHLVGSGRFGMAISEDHDCNVYLIDGGGELALVDSGAGYAGELFELVRTAGFDPRRIGKVFLTHKHADHAGGAADLQRRTGATVLASAATAAAVQDAIAMDAGLEGARRSGGYPSDYRFDAISRVEVVSDGQTLQVGDLEVKVLDTAGHCDGHLAFVLEADGTLSVFTGDALLPGGEIVLQPRADLAVAASIASIERLESLRFDVLFPGHQSPALRGGFRHAGLAMLAVRAGRLPAAFRMPAFRDVVASDDRVAD